jgi:hypothetical protein
MRGVPCRPPIHLATSRPVIVCALDAAYINATDENSNGCLSRSFADIKELPRLLFQLLR